MVHRLRDIAAALGADAAGDLDMMINRASEPAMAGPDDLALAMDPRYSGGLAQGRAKPKVCPRFLGLHEDGTTQKPVSIA